jgi:hypothetical protein
MPARQLARAVGVTISRVRVQIPLAIAEAQECLRKIFADNVVHRVPRRAAAGTVAT